MNTSPPFITSVVKAVRTPAIAVAISVLFALLTLGPLGPYSFGFAGAQDDPADSGDQLTAQQSADFDEVKGDIDDLHAQISGQLDDLENKPVADLTEADADAAKNLGKDAKGQLEQIVKDNEHRLTKAEKDDLKQYAKDLGDQLKQRGEALEDTIKDAIEAKDAFCPDGRAYYVEYSDGRADYIGTGDRSELDWCGGNDVSKTAFETAAQAHGKNWTQHAPELHVSCSDPGIWIDGAEVTKSTIPAGVTVNGAVSWIRKDSGEFCGDKLPPADPNVGIVKSTSDASVAAGDTFTFTLDVTSDGDAPADNVTVTDTVPTGLTILSVSPSADCSTSGQNVTCNLGTMDNGTSRTITIQVRATVDACPDVTNTAQVSADEDANPDDNSSSVDVDVMCDPNVGIEKSSSDASVDAGDTFSFTLEVTSDGNAPADNVTVTDTVPTGLTILSVSPSADCSINGQDVTCDLDTMDNGTSRTITINVRATVDACPDVTNTAQVSADEDANPDDNSSSVDVDVICHPDVVVVKSADRPTVSEGGQWTYELVVTNNGHAIAQNVTVTDDLPAGVDFVSASAGCTEFGGTVTCDLDTVDVGEDEHVSIVVQAADGTCGDVINRGVVSASNEPAANTGNNESNPVTVDVECLEIEECFAPVDVQIRDADTGGLVTTGGGIVHVNGDPLNVGSSGVAFAGDDFVCESHVRGTLTKLPAEYTEAVVAFDQILELPESGGVLIFSVRRAPVEDCTGPVDAEVRHADTGELIGGGEALIEGDNIAFDSTGRADVGIFDCGDEVIGQLTSPPTGYVTVDGFDRIDSVTESGNTLVFTVRPEGTEPCVGPLTIEVYDVDTGELVGGGQSAVEGDAPMALDADGRTPAGDWDCGRDISGTLTQAPSGYDIVTGRDRVTMTEDGATLVFTVRVEPEEEPCVGELTVRIIDTDGNLVGGGTVEVDETGYVLPSGEIVFPSVDCGVIDVSLIEPPDEYAETNDSPESPVTVTIEDGDEAVVEFIVDQVEVQPRGPEDREPEPAPETTPPAATLPRTGTDPRTGLLLSLITVALGGALVRLASTRRRAGEEG